MRALEEVLFFIVASYNSLTRGTCIACMHARVQNLPKFWQLNYAITQYIMYILTPWNHFHFRPIMELKHSPKIRDYKNLKPIDENDVNSSQPGWSSCPEEDQKIHLEAREIRTNSWWASPRLRSYHNQLKFSLRYLNIYMLWLSTIFNIILPIVSLVLLNTFITRSKLINIFIACFTFIVKLNMFSTEVFQLFLSPREKVKRTQTNLQTFSKDTMYATTYEGILDHHNKWPKDWQWALFLEKCTEVIFAWEHSFLFKLPPHHCPVCPHQDDRAALGEPGPNPDSSNPQHKCSRLNGQDKYITKRGGI